MEAMAASTSGRPTNLPSRPLRYVDNYKKLYMLDVDGVEGHDQFLYLHPNGLCVVGAAPSHPAVRARGAAEGAGGGGVAGGAGGPGAVSFETGTGDKKNLANSAGGKGKNKRGAKIMNADAAICHVTAPDGGIIKLRACARGKLLELNERLLSEPELLQNKPTTEGFVAVLHPFTEELARLEEACVSAEEFTRRRGIPVWDV